VFLAPRSITLENHLVIDVHIQFKRVNVTPEVFIASETFTSLLTLFIDTGNTEVLATLFLDMFAGINGHSFANKANKFVGNLFGG
jgi:hypothetical protein